MPGMPGMDTEKDKERVDGIPAVEADDGDADPEKDKDNKDGDGADPEKGEGSSNTVV
ncbi:MAG: hypothetical protein AAB499_02210 [Patescibacteria group bacterium]